MSSKLYKVAAFTLNNGGGNIAGVVLDADALTDVEMQKIAFDAGFSETAFVSTSLLADFKVRFFTPTSEVDLCGHATIATFSTMKQLGIITVGDYTQETKAGVLKIEVQEDIVFMQQNNPMYYEELSRSEISSCFKGLDLDDRFPIVVMSTGVKEIFLPVSSRVVLQKLIPNFANIIEVSKKFKVIGIHVFTVDGKADAYSRNFAPLVGIDEESATGTSNGALSCYLYDNHDKKNDYILRQGYSMDLPSEIISKLVTKKTMIMSVFVGGKATIL